MNNHLYSYAQIQARKQLPALRRALGKVERDIERDSLHINDLETDAEFSARTKTSHRPFPAPTMRLIAKSIRNGMRDLYVKREQLLAAIAQIETPDNPPRRLSAEARRALAELPGTRPVMMSVGQRALCRALGAEPTLTGTSAKSHQHKTRIGRMIEAA